MDYLQYIKIAGIITNILRLCFKPYYKWITFNTYVDVDTWKYDNYEVLNLIINGLPSIHRKY